MSVYDCFSFFGAGAELDLLEIRLNELGSVVDHFVLVEATKTHTGLDKPLYYLDNIHNFPKMFTQKIIHIIVNDMPMTDAELSVAISPQDRKWLDTGYQLGANWVRERFQRNQIMRGLQDCSPDDIIIIEDADEMVRSNIIANLENILVDGSNCVEQEFRTCYANWRCTNMSWSGSKVLRRKFVSNPSEHRFHTPASGVIYKGGWHMNFWGGSDAIRRKILSYAHDEFCNQSTFDQIDLRLRNMQDVLGRQYKYELVPMPDPTLPKYFLSNLDKFSKYIYKE